MIPINLPNMLFSLPPDAGMININQYKELSLDLEKIGRGNHHSLLFMQRCDSILSHVNNGKSIYNQVKTIRDIRIILHLWQTNKAFIQQVPINSKIIKCFKKIQQWLSPSLLNGMIRIFFDQYDNINDCALFCKTIQDSLSRIKEKKFIRNELKIYKHYGDKIFNPNTGPFISWAKTHSLPLDQWIDTCHIPKSSRNRFFQQCIDHYFIKPLIELQLGMIHSVMNEIKHSSLKLTPYQNELTIGHIMVIHLMDRVDFAKITMPDAWIKWIIELMGDPRVPTTSSVYQQWWATMPAKYNQLMRKWLSQIDLKVFLEVLEEVGRRSGNEKINRMFPARKTFLQGLYKSEYITDTRLFLSAEASKYIQDRYDESERPRFTKVNHRNKSVIYLNVGGIHFFEGTHNFSVRLLDDLPKHNPITLQEDRKISLQELATGLDFAYQQEKGTDTQLPYIISHDIHQVWQRKLIKAFHALGIQLDPKSLLSKDDYNQYLKEEQNNP